jgi:hypothetical protein
VWAAALAWGIAAVPGLLSAQSRSNGVARETGQFTVSGVVVWLRVTDDGTVLVYAARGYRSAFTHPASISADDAERWADAAAHLMATDSARSATHSGPAAPARAETPSSQLSLGDGDVTVQTEMDGNNSVLVAQVAVHEPDKQMLRAPAVALGPVISTLRETARVARSAHEAASAAEARAAAVSAPVAPSIPAKSQPAAAPASTATFTAITAPPVRPADIHLPAFAAQKALHTDSVRAAKPAPALPAVTEAKPLPAVVADRRAAKTPAQEAHIGTVEDAPDSRIAYAAPSSEKHAVDTAGPQGSPATAAPAANGSAANPASAKEVSGSGTARSSATQKFRDSTPVARSAPDTTAAPDSVAERALSTGGRLPPSALGDAIRQRQQLLQFCYTEYGLHVDPNLAGQIVVRIVIQQSGTVSDVSIAHHSWSGHAADQVESCIRKRVATWQFPSAERASTHEIQLIFGR